LVGEKEMPLPLDSWGTQSWVKALEAKPSTVSKYISEKRKRVLSAEYTFLLA
jgi:hypothetical protein